MRLRKAASIQPAGDFQNTRCPEGWCTAQLRGQGRARKGDFEQHRGAHTGVSMRTIFLAAVAPSSPPSYVWSLRLLTAPQRLIIVPRGGDRSPALLMDTLSSVPFRLPER